ncbi:MAG TPA: citryl-CoA lyase [Candidatus Nanoarchaeia archaeon]|nr:citrate synthase 1 [uncultured archaeon]
MSEKERWSTSITTHDENGDPIIRGYNLLSLIQKVNFTQAIFLVLRGELPNEREEKLLNAILVSAIDHGVGAPSTTVARITASSGVPSSTAIANGIAAIGENHGGAAEAAAKMLQENINKSASEVVADYKERSKRVPGFGHKIYEVDPRTQTLIKIAEGTGFNGKYVKLSLEIEKELEKSSGKKLPLNIDGVTAALMSEMGFDYRLGKSLFIIARVAGLAAHVLEEQEAKTLRRLDESDVDYTGPSKRSL